MKLARHKMEYVLLHFWVEKGDATDHKRGTYKLEHVESWWNHQMELANEPCFYLLEYL